MRKQPIFPDTTSSAQSIRVLPSTNQVEFFSLQIRASNLISRPRLQLGEDIFRIFAQSGPDDPVSLISFVGKTGSGKSLIVSLLLSDSPSLARPAISRPNMPTSMSHDIYAFPSTDHNYFLDCEGFGGTDDTQTLPPEIESSIHEQYPRVRREMVESTYPRLLYVFSNVICFIFDGPDAQAQSIMQEVLKFAHTGARKATNLACPPHLFVILNKREGSSCKPEEEAKEHFRRSNPDLFDRVQVLFSSVTIAHLPDASYEHNFLLFATNIQSIKALLFDAAKKAAERRSQVERLHNKSEVLDLLQQAIELLRNNPNSVIDPLDLARRKASPPRSLPKRLMAYMEKVKSEVQKSSIDVVKSFDLALEHLSSRLLEVYLINFSRAGEGAWRSVGFAAASPSILGPFEEALHTLEAYIADRDPCRARDPNGNPCGCERTVHDNFHRSAEAQPWAGSFQGSLRDSQAAQLHKRLLHDLRHHSQITVEEFHESRRNRRGAWNIWNATCPEVCIGCILNSGTEALQCGHYLCHQCCEECPNECLACGQKSEWKPLQFPASAGFRILSLDGGGIRGIVELLTLQRLSTYLFGIPIIKFFDLIAGTSTGGLIALALGAKGLSIDEGIDMYRTLGTLAFVHRFGVGIPVVGVLLRHLLYGHKYQRSNLHNELEKVRLDAVNGS